MADIKYWLWFVMAIGHKRATASKLLEKVNGDPGRLYNFKESQLKELCLLGHEDIKKLCNKDMYKVERELRFAQMYGVKIISQHSPEYPIGFFDYHDPPFVLYIRGEHFQPENELSIAIVGTRECSQHGFNTAKRLACELAECGITIVSGMAKGIDAAAHRGALEANGKTLAVLGCGVNIVYPKENEQLMGRIMNNGSVISEFPFETTPLAGNFPLRNRIISGLSLGVVIVEAKERSGALITADMALEQGKEVFAVPGNVGNPLSGGTNLLIKNGAKLITDVYDILEEYQNQYEHIFSKKPSQADSAKKDKVNDELSQEQQLVLTALKDGQKHIEVLCRICNLDMGKINGILTMLEIQGHIIALPGKIYSYNR